MMIKTFTDPSGTEWDVFEVHPGRGRTVARVPREFRAGWLCFQSVHERRRLAPIPSQWAEWSDEMLAAVLQTTQGMARRTPPAFDAPTPPSRDSGESQMMA
jgi:hypothetical protein